MKMIGVNRAPVWIRPSGQAGDSGCDTFTKKKKKKKKQMKSKQKEKKKKKKELNEHPGSGSDPLIGSDRKGVRHL